MIIPSRRKSTILSFIIYKLFSIGYAQINDQPTTFLTLSLPVYSGRYNWIRVGVANRTVHEHNAAFTPKEISILTSTFKNEISIYQDKL